MDYNAIRDAFADVLPVLFKAAPILAGFIGSPATGIFLALLAAITGCDPCDHCALAKKLKDDPDLFAKLASLDSTHGEWLKKMH